MPGRERGGLVFSPLLLKLLNIFLENNIFAIWIVNFYDKEK